jgi:hypothetical protein
MFMAKDAIVKLWPTKSHVSKTDIANLQKKRCSLKKINSRTIAFHEGRIDNFHDSVL